MQIQLRPLSYISEFINMQLTRVLNEKSIGWIIFFSTKYIVNMFDYK